MQQAGVTPDIRPVVARPRSGKAEATGAPAAAMELPDGACRHRQDQLPSWVPLRPCCSTPLKRLAGIDKDLDLISRPPSSSPSSDMKLRHLGHHNPRLHSDEVLIALSISAVTNPLAERVLKKLDDLRGSDAHFSVILSEEDAKLYKRLGIQVSCEPKYEVKKLYHK